MGERYVRNMIVLQAVVIKLPAIFNRLVFEILGKVSGIPSSLIGDSILRCQPQTEHNRPMSLWYHTNKHGLEYNSN